MDRVRIDIGELGAAGAFGARDEGQLPVAARKASATPAGRRWLSFGLRVVRNAAIAVALMTLVPVSIVMLNGGRLLRAVNYGNTSARLAAAEMVRPFRVPGDPSITPMQAGVAFNTLQPNQKVAPGFPTMERVTRPAVMWRTTPVAPDMFMTARPDLYGGPSSNGVMESVAKGFSPRELEYLRALATAPVWRQYDLVARAPAVDIIGGRFKTPFRPDVYSEMLPLASYNELKELAYASVSRAAYHMVLGQRDSAESVLRSVVSFGFMLIDNSSNVLDELIGRVIVGIGRDALQRFYVIEHDPRASMTALRAPPRDVAGSNSPTIERVSAEESRRRLIARLDNPAVPLGERFEVLRMLSASPCTNVRELMFGPRADVTEAIARARRTVARYPSERALVDLMGRMPAPPYGDPSFNPFLSLPISAATISGVALHNPRLASCMLVLSGVGR